MYGFRAFVTINCLFCDDRAVICHDVGNCQDPHGSSLWLGTAHVRSAGRNPCCEVASFNDVIGVERVD